MGLATWGAILLILGGVLLIPLFPVGILFLVLGGVLFIVGLFSKGVSAVQGAVSFTHCPYCKSEIRKGATVCASCGRDIIPPAAQPAPKPESSTAEREERPADKITELRQRLALLSQEEDSLNESLSGVDALSKSGRVSEEVIRKRKETFEEKLVDIAIEKNKIQNELKKEEKWITNNIEELSRILAQEDERLRALKGHDAEMESLEDREIYIGGRPMKFPAQAKIEHRDAKTHCEEEIGRIREEINELRIRLSAR